jgi:DHA2 family multidrug resistance protein-like MFS transporter
MDETVVAKAGRREVIGLIVLALPTLLLALDSSVLFLALPHLTADLGAGATQQLWIIDIYGFLIAGFLVTMGTLGDRIGRRKLLLIGAAAFGVTSVIAAYSTSAEMLIAARALLGIAGATLMPSTLALINNMFRDPKQRGMAIGAWMSCFMGGVMLGPVIGGALLQHFWWGSAFLISVPVMALLVVVAPVLLPEYRDESAGRLDLTSAVISLAAILPVIYGLKEFAKDGLAAAPVLAILIGLAFGVLFVRRQQGLANPLVDVRLFRSRTFSGGLSLMLLGGIMGGFYFLVAVYLQVVEGNSPLVAGLWLVPPTLAAMVTSMMAPAIAQKVRPGSILAAGMVIAAAGLLMITQVDGGVAVLIIGLVVASAGAGPLGALSTDLVVGGAPPEKSGSAAAMSETSAELGVALGVAVVGSIGTAVYRGQINDGLGGVPAEAAEATREGIAGAAAAAAELPAAVGADLFERAGEAFTNGLNVAAGASGLAALALALVAGLVFRHVAPYGENKEEPEPAAAAETADESAEPAVADTH